MRFVSKLRAAWKGSGSMVCVGLDPDPARLPENLVNEREPLFAFNRAIIDATADLVCAYKPQFAYYAACGAEDQLLHTFEYIHRRYPKICTILDAKRGDVPATAEMYAREAFERFNADAVTVNPYLGGDALQPFLDHVDRGVFVLCRTSNPGASDLQNILTKEGLLFEVVARKAVSEWNARANVGLVVGATYPKELRRLRQLAPDLPFLVPGIGAQGGEVDQVIEAGVDESGWGLVVNSSRGIIYAGSGPDFARQSRNAVVTLRNSISAALGR